MSGRLRDQSVTLQQDDRLIIGYSHYRWRATGSEGRLQALQRTGRLLQPDEMRRAGVEQYWRLSNYWRMDSETPWRLPALWTTVVCVLGMLWLLLPYRPMHNGTRRWVRGQVILALLFGGLGFIGYLKSRRYRLSRC